MSDKNKQVWTYTQSVIMAKGDVSSRKIDEMKIRYNSGDSSQVIVTPVNTVGSLDEVLKGAITLAISMVASAKMEGKPAIQRRKELKRLMKKHNVL